MSNLSLPKDKIRILLLENIHQTALSYFSEHGYATIEHLPGALDEAALIERIGEVHMLGIRSRTKITPAVLEAAEKLIAIGCFCIGTNQVDLTAAEKRGVPVFNAPYSNTRSVAELVLGEMILLMRGVPQRSTECHAGQWVKSAKGSNEVRGKTLGIVGYGHIGTQVSVLAEALGMRVIYFDIVEKLAIGNATPVRSLGDLLEAADIVTLHVPSTPETANMMGGQELSRMKEDAVLVNASRGNVVVIDALAERIKAGQLRGAALDVFPKEPKSADEPFVSPLQGLPNVILTPHIGGSTVEAQAGIGREVAEKLVKYSDDGSTLGAVNFPEVALPQQSNVTRFLHIHRNQPGVMSAMNELFSSHDINIAGQYLMTDAEVGYVVVDVNKDIKPGDGFRRALGGLDGTLKLRFLN